MAFTTIAPKAAAPATPDLLFRELPRRKIPDVLPHQQSMMQRYAAEAEHESDVALQLPTGSGKTLVGLLIAEWRRRKHKEKVVHLCPTKQLVHQVVHQAERKYGLSVVGFTGSRKNYSPTDMAKYNQIDCVAVTTYSSLFNTNPYFNNADVIIVDDAHAAENYVASLWTLNISKNNPSHLATYVALTNIFKSHLDPVSFSRLINEAESPADLSWVDKIPAPVLYRTHDEISEVLDASVGDSDLKHAWSMLRGNLRSCHIYLTPKEIFIRPLIAPTWTHAPFSNAKQRIYMSATLGAGGDLERLLGRKKIHRLPVPTGWDSQGVGRRFFMFPSMSLSFEETISLRRDLMRMSPRSLVLVPSDYMENEITEDVNTNVSTHTVYSASDIEESKDDFVASTSSVAIVANRYDGIDFPGDECRLLFIEGLPRAVNPQERFLMSRMGANVLFNERIQTRIVQAIGRCTRSLEDYSAVVVTGEELPDYLADPRRRDYFHPELQAELWFGVEQSKDKTLTDFTENYSLFIENGEQWEQANQMIVNQRNVSIERDFPCIEQLDASAKTEVEYQIAMWNQDYVDALSKAESVIGTLVAPELRGYRALWEYLSGAAAELAATANPSLLTKSRHHYSNAKAAAMGIPWLVRLSMSISGDMARPGMDSENELLMLQVERIESLLQSLGTTHERKYAKREQTILSGLMGKDAADNFENAHKLLGEHLGFDTGKVESDASPDPWWQSGNICFVFEDHANAEKDSSLDATKARQVASHPEWMKYNVESCKSAEVEILPVLVTPVLSVHPGAAPHLRSVYLWKLPIFLEWATGALATIRELRKDFVEPGNLVWRMRAAELLQSKGLDAISLANFFKANVAGDLLHIK